MMSLLYLVVAYIIPIAIGLVAYILIAKYVSKDLTNVINRYGEKEGVISKDLRTYLINKQKLLVNIGSFVWPLTGIFLIGYSLGDALYLVKINKSYENRIGAWFV